MGIYISPENDYPRFQGDIKIANPEWEPGQPLPQGWNEVEDVPMPEVPLDNLLEEEFPKNIKGKWVRSYKIRPMTEEEKERRDAPKTAKAKLAALGLTEVEIQVLLSGMVR